MFWHCYRDQIFASADMRNKMFNCQTVINVDYGFWIWQPIWFTTWFCLFWILWWRCKVNNLITGLLFHWSLIQWFAVFNEDMKVLLKTLKGQIQPGSILLKQGAFMAWFHSLKMTRESTSSMSTALYEQQ